MLITGDEAVATESGAGEPAEGGASEAEAAREIIMMMMAPRFGSAPPVFRRRLAEIDEPARLYEILDKVLEVDSIDELGLGS